MSHILVKKLGRGAFGEAVLYRRTDDNQLVVIKEFEIEGSSQRTCRQAMAECETLAMLTHPNIVMYYDAFQDDEHFFLEMEYADMGTLRDLVVKRDSTQLLLQSEVSWYAWQLFFGMNYVHECNVLHRDIKTENIFMTSRGILKIGDFGIARVLNTAKYASTAVGTPYYMAPEMFQGVAYNVKSDVFSCGCVIHELCTLERTFEADNIGAIMFRMMRGQYPPIDSGAYSASFREVVGLMLSTDPDMRPTTAEVLNNDEIWDSQQTFFAKKLQKLHSSGTRATLSSSSAPETIDPPISAERDEELVSIAVSEEGERRVRPRSTSPMTGNMLSASSTGMFVNKQTALHVWGGGISHTTIDEFSVDETLQAAKSRTKSTSILSENFFSASSSLSSPSNVIAHVVSVGGAHFGVATADMRVFTWCMSGSLTGEDGYSYGQLGHGTIASQRQPKVVAALRHVPCVQVACGGETTLCLTHTGQVLSFGSNFSGCLGIGESLDEVQVSLSPLDDAETMEGENHQQGEEDKDEDEDEGQDMSEKNEALFDGDNAILPIAIPFFRHKKIVKISCGVSHCGAISSTGELYMWGSGELGKLGNGAEDDVFSPVMVPVSPNAHATDITCGPDATAVLTAYGQVFCTGSNSSNKLCLNQRGFLVQKRKKTTHEEGTTPGEVRVAYKFVKAKSPLLSEGIRSLSLGENNLAAITLDGQLVMCGSNAHGQLGVGDTQPRPSCVVVGGELMAKEVLEVGVGDTFCVVIAREHKSQQQQQQRGSESTRPSSQRPTQMLFGWGQNTHQRLSPLGKALITLPMAASDIHNVCHVSVAGPVTLVNTETVVKAKVMQQAQTSRLPSRQRTASTNGSQEVDEDEFEVEEYAGFNDQTRLCESKDPRFEDGFASRTDNMINHDFDAQLHENGDVFELEDSFASSRLLESTDEYARLRDVLEQQIGKPKVPGNSFSATTAERETNSKGASDSRHNSDDRDRSDEDDDDSNDDDDDIPAWLASELGGAVITDPRCTDTSAEAPLQANAAPKLQQRTHDGAKSFSPRTKEDLEGLSHRDLVSLVLEQQSQINGLVDKQAELVTIIRAVRLSVSNFVDDKVAPVKKSTNQ